MNTMSLSFNPLQHAAFSNGINSKDVAPSGDSINPLSPVILSIDKELALKNTELTKEAIRPRGGSDGRRAALGLTKKSLVPKASMILAPACGKRNTGANTTSMDQKENVVTMGSIVA
jgi:hypothetical protein